MVINWTYVYNMLGVCRGTNAFDLAKCQVSSESGAGGQLMFSGAQLGVRLNAERVTLNQACFVLLWIKLLPPPSSNNTNLLFGVEL